MSNRKEKPIVVRVLSCVSAFVLLGVGIYGLIVGISWYSGSIAAMATLGLVVPSVISGDSALDMIAGTFEAFLDGLMEVFGGIFDLIGSIFS